MSAIRVADGVPAAPEPSSPLGASGASGGHDEDDGYHRVLGEYRFTLWSVSTGGTVGLLISLGIVVVAIVVTVLTSLGVGEFFWLPLVVAAAFGALAVWFSPARLQCYGRGVRLTSVYGHSPMLFTEMACYRCKAIDVYAHAIEDGLRVGTRYELSISPLLESGRAFIHFTVHEDGPGEASLERLLGILRERGIPQDPR